mgnify:FL=1|jgi:uncharacterized protein (DUF1499 family)|tara:strand:+ start:502 stop:897 length:396 start_codon:yes stop_codon:yes gene_type:complete
MLVLMKIFFVSFFIFIGFIFPSASFASHIELSECVEIAHCVREEWEVDSIEQPFKEVKEIIENTPRSVIVELDGDYLHAEVTSKWMKYVDDLEVSFVPESRKLLVRSESRVGEGDLGVNQKRVDLLKSKLF